MGLLIAGVILLGLGVSCGTGMALLVFHEIAVVNRKYEMQIPYFAEYGFKKMDHIKAAYKELYPNGSVESWRLRLTFAMVSFLALAAIASVIGASMR